MAHNGLTSPLAVHSVRLRITPAGSLIEFCICFSAPCICVIEKDEIQKIENFEEVADIVEGGDGIEHKLEDLTGLTVEIIANVDFDEYSERSRLKPKKIISKYF